MCTGVFQANFKEICSFVAARNGNIPITRGNKTAFSPKMDQSIFPLLYFVY